MEKLSQSIIKALMVIHLVCKNMHEYLYFAIVKKIITVNINCACFCQFLSIVGSSKIRCRYNIRYIRVLLSK